MKKWTLIALTVALTFATGFIVSTLMLRRAADAKRDAEVAQLVASTKLPRHLGKPLPAARLFGVGNQPVSDAALRQGKVMLVLITTGCDACQEETAFLRTLVASRKDIRFLGVLSFEQDESTLLRAQSMFPFPVVRDDRMELMRALQLSSVPVKIYLEDGVVKRSWGGASMTAEARAAFAEWLRRA